MGTFHWLVDNSGDQPGLEQVTEVEPAHKTSSSFGWLRILVTNQCPRIIGKVENTERFTRLALFQGVPQKDKRARGLQSEILEAFLSLKDVEPMVVST